jgi:hypothetical protein
MKTWPTSSVNSLYFSSSGGTNSFTNETSINAVFDGRLGVNTMTGGFASNTFWANANDTINPGGSNVTFGLVNNVNHADLAAQGSLAAVLNNDGTLSLCGPGGVGFKLAGNWQDINSSVAETFHATGTVTMESALGDIPFPTGALGMNIFTAPDNTTGAGVVTSMSSAGLPFVNLTSIPSLNSLANELGLNVSVPNVSWGIDLGSNLNVGVPVNPGVPYCFASINSGFTVSLGGASVSTPGGASLAIVIDPADPSVEVSANLNSGFAVGASAHGWIPFIPVSQPSAISGGLYGHLYGLATFPLGDYPVTVTGSTVINLDANNTGHVLGISGNIFSELIHGKLSLSALAEQPAGQRRQLSGRGRLQRRRAGPVRGHAGGQPPERQRYHRPALLHRRLDCLGQRRRPELARDGRSGQRGARRRFHGPARRVHHRQQRRPRRRGHQRPRPGELRYHGRCQPRR